MKVAALRATGVVPKPIVDTLLRLIRRTRWLIALRGVCATVAAAVGALLLVMAIDASVTLYSLSTRWVLSASAYAITVGAALVVLGAAPRAHSFTLSGIARTIESRHPELQERISSAVELLTTDDAPELRGSEQLIGALVEQATGSVRGIQPRREVSLATAKPFLVVAAAVLAILAGLFALWPDTTAFLLARASAPFLNRPNLLGRDLTVEPGDMVLAEGQRLEVQVAVPRRSVRRAHLLVLGADGKDTSQRMALLNPGADGRRFALTTAPATQDFDYRVQAGDALSAFYHVEVVPRPAVEQIDLRYDPPSYTRRPPETLQATDGNIRALRGTVVTLTARTNKPVQAAELVINDEPAPGKRLDTPPGDPVCSFRFILTPELAGRWSLKLTDEHGFASSTAEHTIELVPDNPPTVTIVTPDEKSLRLPPTARVPIAFTMEDDIGIRRGDVLVEVDGRPRPPIDIALDVDGDAPLTAATGETTLALTSLNLRGAKYLTFQLRATDGLPKPFKGPQQGVSELYRIDLDVRAPSFDVAQLMDAERKLKDTLKKVEKDLRKAKSDAQRLKRDLAKAKEPTRNDNERIDRLRTELANAEANARRAAEMMRDSHYEGLVEKAQELADKHISKAENLAGQINLADEPRERGMLAKETERTIDRSLEAVKELLEEIEPVTDVVRKALEAQELADRQADLAREKLAMDKAQQDGKAAEGQMTDEDWKKAQEALAADLAKMAKETPGAERASREMDAKAAAEAAQEAAEMAKEQQALADAARRLDKLQEVDEALAELAKQQDELGREAAAADATRDQAAGMDQAADAIRADQLDKAVQQQAAAEAALKKKAEELAQAAADQAPQPGDAAQPAGDQAQAPADAAQPAGDQAQAPADAAQPAGDQAQAPADAAQPAGDQAQAPADAAQPAGAQAQAPADAAQPEGDQAPQPGDAAKQAADLAERQGDLRERTDALRQERDELGAEHAQDQAERLQAEQAEVAREAQELAGDVGEAAPQADRLQDQAANAAGEAAEALREGQMGEAAEQAERAGQQLDQLAERLEQAAAAPFAPEAQPAGAEAGEQPQAGGEPAGAEAGEQPQAGGEPAGAEAGEQPPAGGEPAGAEAGEQPQAGGEPAGAEAGEQPQAGGEPAGAEAGEQPQAGGEPAGAEAGEQPQAGGEPAGAEAGDQAPAGGEPAGAEAGEQAPAAGAEAGQPGDPQQAAGLAQEAAALAERQQQLAREMQALAQGDPLAQAAAQQQALAERAAQLAEQAAAMQQRAQDQGLGAQAQQAAQAAEQLGQAQQQAAAAGEQLAAAQGEEGAAPGQPAPGEQGQPAAGEQGQPAGAEAGQPGAAPGQQPGSQGGQPAPAPSAAQGAQQASAQALNAAAQAMGALAQAWVKQHNRPLGAPAGDPAAAAQQMASAQQSSAQAAQSQSAMPAAQAAGQLGQMAANAASQAQAMGGTMQAPPNPKGGGEPTEGTGAQSADLSKAKLKELGIKLDDWARLPGELRDQILQAAQQSGPAEYRSLIKRYFQQIAKRGGAKPKAKK